MNLLDDLGPAWPQLNRLLDEALALPPAQRASWLGALPAEHAALKPALERLLQARTGFETDSFLGTLPRLDGLSPPAAPAGAGPAPGDSVGPWRLLSALGEGGMGSVWLAERADGQLKRPVALKLPRLSWARGLADRMARERDILATLEHPNIARLYDAGVDALGRPWLALEVVQGRPIDVFARERALTVRQRVALLLQVCDAVSYAHGRLVIHRDLKPANILVTDDGQVRLLDFGIARLVDTDAPGGPADEFTLAAFTPAYASPEQLRREPLGTASDVYSLGVVAHELLCGRRPFDDRPEASGERLRSRLADDPPRPSAGVFDAAGAAQRSTRPAAWRRAIAGDLDAVLMQALARDPARRQVSVQALGDDLRRWSEGRPVQARSPSLGYVLGRFVQRHRLAVGAGSLAVASLAATAWIAVAQGLQARHEAQRAQAASAYLVGLFERADPDGRGGREAGARELLAQGEEAIDTLAPAAQADVLQTVSRLWLHYGELARAERALARWAALAQQRQDVPALVRASVAQAHVRVLDRRPAEAQALLQAAEQQQPAHRWPPETRALAAELRGWLALEASRPEQALAHFEQATAPGLALEQRLRGLQGRATTLSLLNRPEEAHADHERLRLLAETDPASTPRLRALTLQALAGTYFMAGRYAQGREVCEAALTAARALYGEAATAQLRLREWWVRYAVVMGDPQPAAAWLRAQTLSEDDLRSAGQDTPVYWHLLVARVWARVGDAAAADAALAAAQRARAALPAEVSAELESVQAVAQADAALALGRVASVPALLARADSSVAARRELLRGVALARQGQAQAAVAAFEAALAASAGLGDIHTGLLARLNLAALLAPRDAPRARALLAQAQGPLQQAFGAQGAPARAATRLVAALDAAPQTLAMAERHLAPTPLFH